MKIYLKRVYEERSHEDGFRVLADRLWPRGIKKENLGLNLWAKEIAPSIELRKHYHQDGNFEAFSEDYIEELDHNSSFADFCEMLKAHKVITLLTASKNIEKSAFPVLLSQIT